MTLLYVARDHVPLEEGDVRSTTNVVRPDDTSATATVRPEWNGPERDPDTEGGLTPRSVSDKVNASEQYAPAVGNANTDFNARVDDQVSTSGTAAAREAAGQWGHGTGYSQESLEPAIVRGTEFADTYFRASRPPIQDGTLDYMVPTRRPDNAGAVASQAATKAAARQASASLYQAWLESGS